MDDVANGKRLALPPVRIHSPVGSIGYALIATQAAMGIAAVHNVDKDGVASIAHTDITPGQFVLVDGVYRLNDFNRARFIRWSRTENKPCKYYIGRNPGKVRPSFTDRGLEWYLISLLSYSERVGCVPYLTSHRNALFLFTYVVPFRIDLPRNTIMKHKQKW